MIFQAKTLVRRMYKENLFTPTRKAKKLLARIGCHLSPYQVRRLRRACGLERRRIRYGFPVRYGNRLKRMRYCTRKLNQNESFHRHLFLDETMIQLHSNRLPAYVPEEERYAHVISAPKYDMKVMVVAAISYRGPAHLVLMKTGRTINASVYQRILDRSFLPWAEVCETIQLRETY